MYPGARELLEALHEKYIRVGVCTDLLAHIQHRKLRRLGMMDDVDCLVTSEEAGVENQLQGFLSCVLRSFGCLQRWSALWGTIWNGM